MHLTMLLEMAADAFGDRTAFGHRGPGGLTYAELARPRPPRRDVGERARRRARRPGRRQLRRRADAALRQRLRRRALRPGQLPPRRRQAARRSSPAPPRRSWSSTTPVPGRVGIDRRCRAGAAARLPRPARRGRAGRRRDRSADPDDIAVLLFTSGTTGEPKAAVLRHRHLTSYVIGTVEFMGADEDEAALVSVPPYHIAGISAVAHAASTPAGGSCYLPSVHARGVGRRRPATRRSPTRWWCRRCSGRILDVLERDRRAAARASRHLAYGGGRMPVAGDRAGADAAAARRLRQRLRPDRDQLDDRRARARRPPRWRSASDDPAVRRRLGSVGRPLPTLEVEIRDADGEPVAPGADRRDLGARRAGRRASTSAATTCIDDGWFPTRDGGSLDEDGLPLPRGPPRRRDRPRRREHLARRDRGRAASPIRRSPTPAVVGRARQRVGREGRRRRRAGRGRGGDRGRAAGLGQGAPALVEDPGARAGLRESCPTTTPASCCAASCASELAEQFGA